MIGPIFYILLIFALVAAPAITGWKLSRKHGQSIRMMGTILAGQLILTPAVAYFAFSKNTLAGDNPVQTALTYTAMALVISIMTFAVLEIKYTHKSKKSMVPVTASNIRDDPANVQTDFVEPL